MVMGLQEGNDPLKFTITRKSNSRRQSSTDSLSHEPINCSTNITTTTTGTTLHPVGEIAPITSVAITTIHKDRVKKSKPPRVGAKNITHDVTTADEDTSSSSSSISTTGTGTGSPAPAPPPHLVHGASSCHLKRPSDPQIPIELHRHGNGTCLDYGRQCTGFIKMTRPAVDLLASPNRKQDVVNWLNNSLDYMVSTNQDLMAPPSPASGSRVTASSSGPLDACGYLTPSSPASSLSSSKTESSSTSSSSSSGASMSPSRPQTMHQQVHSTPSRPISPWDHLKSHGVHKVSKLIAADKTSSSTSSSDRKLLPTPCNTMDRVSGYLTPPIVSESSNQSMMGPTGTTVVTSAGITPYFTPSGTITLHPMPSNGTRTLYQQPQLLLIPGPHPPPSSGSIHQRCPSTLSSGSSSDMSSSSQLPPPMSCTVPGANSKAHTSNHQVHFVSFTNASSTTTLPYHTQHQVSHHPIFGAITDSSSPSSPSASSTFFFSPSSSSSTNLIRGQNPSNLLMASSTSGGSGSKKPFPSDPFSCLHLLASAAVSQLEKEQRMAGDGSIFSRPSSPLTLITSSSMPSSHGCPSSPCPSSTNMFPTPAPSSTTSPSSNTLYCPFPSPPSPLSSSSPASSYTPCISILPTSSIPLSSSSTSTTSVSTLNPSMVTRSMEISFSSPPTISVICSNGTHGLKGGKPTSSSSFLHVQSSNNNSSPPVAAQTTAAVSQAIPFKKRNHLRLSSDDE